MKTILYALCKNLNDLLQKLRFTALYTKMKENEKRRAELIFGCFYERHVDGSSVVNGMERVKLHASRNVTFLWNLRANKPLFARSQKTLIYLAPWFMQRLVHKANSTILQGARANSKRIITAECITPGDPRFARLHCSHPLVTSGHLFTPNVGLSQQWSWLTCIRALSATGNMWTVVDISSRSYGSSMHLYILRSNWNCLFFFFFDYEEKC